MECAWSGRVSAEEEECAWDEWERQGQLEGVTAKSGVSLFFFLSSFCMEV